MSHQMKYVVLNYDTPIIFFDIQKHSDFKQMGNITSAGFITIFEDRNECDTKCMCYGESTSLKIKSDPDDTFMFNTLLTKY